MKKILLCCEHCGTEQAWSTELGIQYCKNCKKPVVICNKCPQRENLLFDCEQCPLILLKKKELKKIMTIEEFVKYLAKVSKEELFDGIFFKNFLCEDENIYSIISIKYIDELQSILINEHNSFNENSVLLRCVDNLQHLNETKLNDYIERIVGESWYKIEIL